MSDYQALFRQAKAQRGVGTSRPSKEQIKAMKARKLAEQQEHERRQQQEAAAAVKGGDMAPPPPRLQAQRTAGDAGPRPSSNSAGEAPTLPHGFFDSQAAHASRDAPSATNPKLSEAALPSAPAVGMAGARSGRTDASAGTNTDATSRVPAPVPKGFFDDKAADMAARGIKQPGKAEKEEAFVEFTAAVVQDMQEQAAAEAAAVQDEVEDRSLREEFEQFSRVERIKELRALAKGELEGEAPELEVEDAVASALPAPARRKRAAEVLAELEASDEDDSSDEGDADDAWLDWRAKRVTPR